MCEQYAGGLVAADAEVAAFGSLAFSYKADLHPATAFVALAVAVPVGALSAGVAVHHGDNGLVGVVYRIE